MYKLPDNVDLSFFKGVLLLQVCIGANEIILRFDDDISITIQTDIAHKSTSGDITAIYKSITASAFVLVSFLHCKIVDVTVVDPSAIQLKFSNGEYLMIYDTSTQYESFQIRHGNDIIVV